MVPFWFRLKDWKVPGGTKMAPSLLVSLCFGAACFAYGSLFLRVAGDWAGFLVREGFISYGAERLRSGEWPYRDYFFFWTPGVIFVHAALQELGAGAALERAASLAAASFSAALVLHETRRWGLRPVERWLLTGLLFLWGFSLWSLPYSSWFAVCFVLLGLRARSRAWWLTGLSFGLAFWFKQNIAIFAALGLLLALIGQRSGRAGAAFLLGAGLVVGLPIGLAYLTLGPDFLHAALAQALVFPLRYPSLMGKALPAAILGAPLITLGLWVSSLYLSKAAPLPRQVARALAVAHGAYGLAHDGGDYLVGFFLVCSLAAWAGALLFLVGEPRRERAAYALLWLPWFGAFLQVFPRADFAHFLFAFPLAAPLLVWALSRLRRRYPSVAPAWAYFPLFVLLLGGALFNGRLLFTRAYGAEDAAGFVSFGENHLRGEELGALRAFLRSEGLRPGDPLLVLPAAPTVYRFTGLRNPTPHNQLFPGYVEAFGASPASVLPDFERAGGRYVVLSRGSDLGRDYPDIARALEQNFEEIRRFPQQFAVWRKRAAP